MERLKLSLLLVEDSDSDAEYIQRTLRKADDTSFEVSRVSWLSNALTAAANKSFSAVLLDLTLPDSHGVDTVAAFMRSFPELPILVLTGYDDMVAGVNSVRYGAQDYILKNDLNSKTLERAIVYAIERKRADLVGKRLMKKTISGLIPQTDDRDARATLAMLQEPVVGVAKFLADLRTYIATNVPSHSESIEQIITKNSVDQLVTGMREIVKPEQETPKRRRESAISEAAMEAVRITASPDAIVGMNPHEAVLAALSGLESIGGGDDV